MDKGIELDDVAPKSYAKLYTKFQGKDNPVDPPITTKFFTKDDEPIDPLTLTEKCRVICDRVLDNVFIGGQNPSIQFKVQQAAVMERVEQRRFLSIHDDDDDDDNDEEDEDEEE